MPKGYIIKDLAEFYRVTTFELPKDVPLDAQTKCPACAASLEPMCTLVGYGGRQQMRIGGCATCGYIGYIDRPTKEWIVNFYSTTWDVHTALSVEQVKSLTPLEQEKKSSRISAAHLAKELPLDRSRNVLEVGCGYGNVLRYFRDRAGFTNVLGIENSSHRAQAVEQAFQIPVLAGNFENEKIQEQLKSKAPFGLIFSHHVFEHVYHPEEFMAAAASLQREGDYLVLAMPDVQGEHAAYVTLYLPHLHAFSNEGLDRLLNRFGYEIIKHESPAPENMIVVAQKKENPKRYFPVQENHRERILKKLQQGLGVEQEIKQPSTLTWLVSGIDDMHIQEDGKLPWLVRKGWQWFSAKALKRFTAHHAMLVTPITASVSTTPFEIQFPKGIMVLMK
ncbi:MAG: class I SAM-dependent methyltransferase [Candidatus Yanofskybacteria bacterium]|nr:class I SAM-dependent methyltransferase [Candidatus Yanofskybacteria bacterium]